MSKRILVIDDDEAIRKSFTLTLEDVGYEVYVAESGEKGIGMEQNTKYDLVFLDLKMPGLNGVETLQELRKIDKDVPIYIITAFHQEFFDRLESAQQEGLDFQVLRKPIAPEELVLVTKGILERPIVH